MVGRHPRNAQKTASQKAKSNNVFGQARRPAKMLRAGLYGRVSTNDQQTLSLQSRAMREYAARRGWTIAMQFREVGSGAAKREAREKLLETVRRREIDVVLVWRLDRWGRSVTDLLATLQELEHLGVGFVSMTEALAGGRFIVLPWTIWMNWRTGQRENAPQRAVAPEFARNGGSRPASWSGT